MFGVNTNEFFRQENFGNLINFAVVHQYDIVIGVLVLFFSYIVLGVIKRSRSNFPPGPTGLPIVGYLPFLSEDFHLDLTKLGKKYGDVFSVQFGSFTVVVLQGAEVIKEAFLKPDILGRPPDSPIHLINPKSPFFADNFHCWTLQRKFTVHAMKDLGLGKTKIEEDIKDEIRHFLEILTNSSAALMDVSAPIGPSMSNNICALVFGKRYEYDDADRVFLDKALHDITSSITQTASYAFFPWLKYVPFYMRFHRAEKAYAAIDALRKFFDKEADKHKKNLDPKNVEDFIDSYIVEMKSRQAKDPDTCFTEEILTYTAVDLFGAGSETVHTSLLWCIYTMAAHQDVQRRVQDEVREVIGLERLPDFQDQKNMPYTHAVILEIMRWKSVVPLNLMHYSLKDTTVGGYDIPKDTIVIANFWNVHHDERYFSEPDLFKPERFLSKDEKSVVKSSNFMPFSLGKRSCPGEAMAHMEIFLYFTSILQKFDIVFPDGFKPTFEAKLGVTYKLSPFMVKFVPKTS